MTTETLAAVTPAPATPAAAAPVAAPAQAAQIDSLIPAEVPAGEAAPVATAPAAADPAKPATPAATHPEWFYANGVKGTGPAPAWYKADKYETMEKQAEAQFHLEKRFGAFVGAPKDGKYEFTPGPDTPKSVQLDTDHPIFKAFNEWAASSQMSQDGYNQVLNMFAQYEASMVPDMAEIKKEVGDNADARITAVAQWGKANLDTETFGVFREAMTGANAAKVLKVVESLIGKQRQPAVQRPGPDVSASRVTGEQEINDLQAKKGPDGKRLYATDPKYRAMVEQKRSEYFASLGQ